MPEHSGPEQGLGAGRGSVGWIVARSDSIPTRGKSPRPIAGRSAGCEQSARVAEGTTRPIARSVNHAPTLAHDRNLGKGARMQTA